MKSQTFVGGLTEWEVGGGGVNYKIVGISEGVGEQFAIKEKGDFDPPFYYGSFPSILLDHVSQLYDELAFFVFLTRFKCVLIFPP